MAEGDSVRRRIRAAMLEDIHEQGDVVAARLSTIGEQVDAVVNRQHLKDVDRILLTGCGDSFYVGMAARIALQEWSGLWVEPVESLELRYLAKGLSPQTLVVGVSVSGQVERTLEAIELARERGAPTVGITATEGSKMYTAADWVIDTGISVREQGPVPQTVHFLANLVSMYLLGLGMGTTTGHLSAEQADELRRGITDALGSVRGVAERNGPKVAGYVEERGAPESLVVVGGGPNWAIAHFGVAKLLEAALTLGVVQELEEWAHEQYFLTGPGMLTVLVGAEGLASDRLSPTAHAVVGLGGSLATILPEGIDPGIESAARWRYPDGTPELLSPILTKVPLELLAHVLAEHLDRRPFDYDNPSRKEIVERTIYRGAESAEAVNRRRRGR